MTITGEIWMTVDTLSTQRARVTIHSCQVQPFATPVTSSYYGVC